MLGHLSNAEKIIALANGADIFFIEACFLDEDKQRAADKYHLTAKQAGELARRANAKRVVPFHFSARHAKQEQQLRREAEEAYQGAGLI